MPVASDVRVRLAAFLVVAGLFGTSASAVPYVWEGDGDDATGDGVPAPDATEVTAGELPFKLWTAANNWNPEAVPGLADSVTFGPPTLAGAVNVAYNTPISVTSITVNEAPISGYEFEAYGAGKLTLAAGGSITLGSNTPGIPFRGPIDLAGSASVTGGAANSSYNFSGASITGLSAGSTLTLNTTTGTANQVGAVSGPINLVRSGAGGSVSFAGQMTYTGSTLILGASNMNLVKVDNCFPVTTMLTLGSASQNGLIRIDNGASITLGGLQVAAVAPGASTLNGLNANSTTLQSTITVNAAQHSSFSGRLGATGAASQNIRFVKTGPAAFTFSTSGNTYAGATEILGGTLEVESGNINGTSGVTINGGRLMYGSTTALTKPVTLTAGTIGGTGAIGTAVSVGANGTVSPGGNVDALGVLSETIATQNYTAGLTLAPRGTYRFDADAATGDLLAVTGTGLTVTATSLNPFVIDVQGQGLTPGTAYTRTLATSSAAIAPFAADQFAVLGGGVGTVSLSDPNTLALNFTTLLPVYWDTNGTAAGAGGAAPAGNWDGAAANFNTDATGGAGGSTVAGTVNFHDVVFAAADDGAGTYAVNVTGTQTAYGIAFARGNVSLSGGTLAVGTFSAAAGATGTIASNVTGGPSGAVVKQGDGTVTLTAANTYTGGTTVAAGTLVAGNANAISTGQALTVAAGATLRSQAGVATALDVSSLSIAPTGRVDVNDGGLVKRNGGSGTGGQTATRQITAALKTGLENGGNFDWLGSGISSTEANADNATAGSVLYGVGVIQNNLAAAGTPDGTTTDATPGGEIYTSFKGRDVGLNDTLVRYTYMGDADLDGSITGTDYSLIDAGFAASLAGWLNGDFDYSGAIDGTDYALIDNAFASQVGPLSEEFLALYDQHVSMFGQEYVGALAAVQAGVVPEPGTLGVLAVAGVGLLARRRRR